MHGGVAKVMKHNPLDNLRHGVPHRFGSNWPGRRCGAKTRSGAPCKAPAMHNKARCRMHGGASCGPTSVEGRLRISALHLKTGEFTTQKKQARKQRAARGRRISAEIHAIEEQLIASAILPRNWRKRFDS
jgi:ribosomal protein S6E (S10)